MKATSVLATLSGLVSVPFASADIRDTSRQNENIVPLLDVRAGQFGDNSGIITFVEKTGIKYRRLVTRGFSVAVVVAGKSRMQWPAGQSA